MKFEMYNIEQVSFRTNAPFGRFLIKRGFLPFAQKKGVQGDAVISYTFVIRRDDRRRVEELFERWQKEYSLSHEEV